VLACCFFTDVRAASAAFLFLFLLSLYCDCAWQINHSFIHNLFIKLSSSVSQKMENNWAKLVSIASQDPNVGQVFFCTYNSFRVCRFHAVCTEFDQVVQQSREEKEKAVQMIPEIEENIREAENSTYWALAALREADTYALAAEELALAAQNMSSSALVVRDVITCMAWRGSV